MYQTTDGKTHTDKAAAKQHQATLDARAALEAEYEPIFKAAPDARRLMIAMLDEPATAAAILTSLAKALKKAEPAPAAQPTIGLAA
jgi:hypothetical protein